MAISPVIANCVQVRLLWTFAGRGGVNVLHAQAAAGVVVNQALADTLGSAIKSAFTTNLAPRMSQNSALVRVGVRDIRVANAAEFLDTGGLVAGTNVGEPLPPQTALCVTLRTAQAGKSFRGRTYLGGFTEADNDVNGISSTAVSTAAIAFLNAVKTAMTSSQLTWAVASRPAEGYVVVKTTTHTDGTTSTKTLTTVKPKAGGAAAITSIQSRDASWETQRRRTNNRGAAPTTFDAVATLVF